MPISKPPPDPEPAAPPLKPVLPTEAEVWANDLEQDEKQRSEQSGGPGADENAPGFIKPKRP
jgi:hypothetical protein